MSNVSELAREEIDALVQHTSSKKPYVGMPATYVIGSDQYAGTLIAVSKTGHQVTWKRAGAIWGHVCSRRRNVEYIQVGSKYGHLILGVSETKLDEGF